MEVETFKDVTVSIESDRIDFLAEEIDSQLKKPWKRRKVDSKSSLPMHLNRYSYEKKEVGDSPSALLSLAQKDTHNWYIPNVVPIEYGQLSVPQYNNIITDFYEHFLSPAAKSLGLTPRITSGRVSDTELLGEKGADALRKFCSHANMSTGASHPTDREFWFDFLIAASKERDRIDTGLLEKMLKAYGWPDHGTHDLVLQFEFGFDLLQHSQK